VLTLCSECKNEIIVKASYEDRNKNFYCKECKKDNEYFLGYPVCEDEIDW
jgi:transposase-like protein